jgi:hypothetical protein
MRVGGVIFREVTMIIYQAGLTLEMILKYHELFPTRKINVLRSFGTLTKEEAAICVTHRDKVGSLVLDSGTFTLYFAKQQASRITIDHYERYLRQFGKDFDFYFNFDEDFGQEGFDTNQGHQKRLERAGLHPVPVIHNIYGDEVDYYIDAGYQMVAVGSQMPVTVNDLYLVTDRLCRAGVRVHLFGRSTYEDLQLPIYSCDSTTWTKMGAYGFIYYWNPHKRGIDKTDKIHIEDGVHSERRTGLSLSTYAFWDDLDTYLGQMLHITVGDLSGPQGHYYRQLVNLDYFVNLESRVNGEVKKTC